MSKSRLHLFGWGMVAATLFALVLASLGAGQARAGNCAALNFTFNLGSANPNTCNTTTSLNSTGAAVGLNVGNTTPDAIAILGSTTAATGAGIGVLGFTVSPSSFTQGVEGDLQNTTPGTDSAGVFGQSFSATSNGAGVWGLHLGDSGSAPGVMGQTNSTAAN